MEFSALPYTPHELENAMHDYELPPIHYTVIRANLQQMGVGGDDSWGARTHDEHLIDVKKPLSFTFLFVRGFLTRITISPVPRFGSRADCYSFVRIIPPKFANSEVLCMRIFLMQIPPILGVQY